VLTRPSGTRRSEHWYHVGVHPDLGPPSPPTTPAPVGGARLLVVDDNEMNRDMLSRRLAKRGHTVETASSGAEALDLIGSRHFDLILLDVMMPGIDGFEVLRRVRRTRSPTQLPVIMATAKDQAQDIVQALDEGASDYVTKPLDFSVVMARVGTQLSLKRSVDQIVALEASLKVQNAELGRVNTRMKRDLDSAARLQQALLPAAAPRNARATFAWAYVPCDELAGDIFNIFSLDDRHVGMYLLDVSGHGVPAALLSVTLSRVLAPVAGQPSLVMRPGPGGLEPVPPGEVIAELSRRFPMNGVSPQYFTIIYAVLDTASATLRFGCAAHTGPAVVRRAGGGQVLEYPAFAVGWEMDAAYQEQRLQLAPGDRVYIYSDGITEAMDQARRQFGNAGILASLEASRSGTLEQSLHDLRRNAEAWRGSASFDDDVSAIAVEWRG